MATVDGSFALIVRVVTGFASSLTFSGSLAVAITVTTDVVGDGFSLTPTVPTVLTLTPLT